MERLWAPWRMSYIGKIAGGTGCFLCDIRQSTDDAANLVVVRRVRTFVVLNAAAVVGLWRFLAGAQKVTW